MAKTGLGISGASEKVIVKTINIPKFGGLQCDLNLYMASASLSFMMPSMMVVCCDQHLLRSTFIDLPL